MNRNVEMYFPRVFYYVNVEKIDFRFRIKLKQKKIEVTISLSVKINIPQTF